MFYYDPTGTDDSTRQGGTDMRSFGRNMSGPDYQFTPTDKKSEYGTTDQSAIDQKAADAAKKMIGQAVTQAIYHPFESSKGIFINLKPLDKGAAPIPLVNGVPEYILDNAGNPWFDKDVWALLEGALPNNDNQTWVQWMLAHPKAGFNAFRQNFYAATFPAEYVQLLFQSLAQAGVMLGGQALFDLGYGDKGAAIRKAFLQWTKGASSEAIVAFLKKTLGGKTSPQAKKKTVPTYAKTKLPPQKGGFSKPKLGTPKPKLEIPLFKPNVNLTPALTPPADYSAEIKALSAKAYALFDKIKALNPAYTTEDFNAAAAQAGAVEPNLTVANMTAWVAILQAYYDKLVGQSTGGGGGGGGSGSTNAWQPSFGSGGGGGGGGGGGFEPGFGLGEETKPETQAAPPETTKEGGGFLPLLAIGALAYFASK